MLIVPIKFPIYSEGIGKNFPKNFKKEGNNMYNYYQPQQRSTLPFLKGHPVSSIDEVRSTAIDFDGSIFYFPDLANNRIYTKQINFDGTASLCMYELSPIEPQLTTDYITRKEFEEALSKIMASQPTIQEDKKKEFSANF